MIDKIKNQQEDIVTKAAKKARIDPGQLEDKSSTKSKDK